jgi:hypothetical protein
MIIPADIAATWAVLLRWWPYRQNNPVKKEIT